MGTISKKTPFFPWHDANGAALYEKGGWTRPARYDDPVTEHLRVRRAGGIVDVHSMGRILVEGPDAAGILEYAATNDVAGLKVGGARYTCLCAPDGGIADDVIVYRTADHRFLLVTNTLSRERVLDLLREQAENRRAHLSDVTSSVAYIAVQGPKCREMLAAAGLKADLSSDALGYFQSAEAELSPVRILLARTGYTGELGYELYFPAEYALDVWVRLCEAGAPLGISPIGGQAMMSLRLEKGYRSYGADIGLGTNPIEAGLGWVIAWDKPDFAGRPALAEIHDPGPKRRAVYLKADPGVSIEPGSVLLGPDAAEVGSVTSGLYGPSLEAHVGLGYISSAAATGAAGVLTLPGPHGGLVRWAKRPFFDPDGTRLRG